MLLCAVLSGGWVAVSFVAAMFASAARLPVSAAFAFAVLFGVAAFSRLARAKVGPRAPLALAFGALVLTPFVFLGAADALSEPLVSSHFRCGTGQAIAILFAPFVLFAWGAGAVMLGFLVQGRSERRALDLATRCLGALALIGGLVVVSLATLRARHGIEPDRFITAVKARSVATDVSRLSWSAVEELEHVERADLAGRTLFRRCTVEGYCNVSFTPDATASDGGASIGKREDPTLMIETSGFTLFLSSGYTSGALDRAGRRADVRLSDVASELSAPRGWIAGGWLAMFGALGFLLLSRTRTVDLRALHDGVVEASGAILLDDGTLWPQPSGVAYPEGTRVVAHRSDEVATFRRDAGPAITLGTLEAMRGEARIRATTWCALSLATTALGLAPLIAASLRGIAL